MVLNNRQCYQKGQCTTEIKSKQILKPLRQQQSQDRFRVGLLLPLRICIWVEQEPQSFQLCHGGNQQIQRWCVFEFECCGRVLGSLRWIFLLPHHRDLAPELLLEFRPSRQRRYRAEFQRPNNTTTSRNQKINEMNSAKRKFEWYL